MESRRCLQVFLVWQIRELFAGGIERCSAVLVKAVIETVLHKTDNTALEDMNCKRVLFRRKPLAVILFCGVKLCQAIRCSVKAIQENYLVSVINIKDGLAFAVHCLEAALKTGIAVMLIIMNVKQSAYFIADHIIKHTLNIVKMIIEAVAVDAAVRNDISNGNILELTFSQELCGRFQNQLFFAGDKSFTSFAYNLTNF